MTDTHTGDAYVNQHDMIVLSDGTRLAARLWLPEEDARPVPAILEYIPYRKRDFTRARDESLQPFFAANGYAGVRVDLRGSGDSEGVLQDEYLSLELDDGVEVIDWIAGQPWCDGNVGMMGISWGGFNALQIAARQPPALKAIVSVSSTDDRYADDVHYMGGCLLGENLSWASVMFAFNSLPPDPTVVGDKWRDMWHERLEHSGLWLETWLQHQHRDDYWRHGSVCENLSDIQVPVMAVSGWADGYTNSVFRLMQHLEPTCRGLVGPWSHRYPHQGEPGPAIDFQRELLRWWDHWLKGRETGIEDDPVLRAWMQDSVPPASSYSYRPGHWVAEQSWPSERVADWRLQLEPGRMCDADQAQEPEALDLQSPLSVGLFAGKWCSYAAGPDLPHDQREEDGGALIFDSEPIQEDMALLGQPVVDLELAATQSHGMVAVRLSDVAEDGKATRCTYGLLNLTHRESHAQPEALEPGRVYSVRVRMNHLGQIIPAGHRLRLSISSSYWPLAWPPSQPNRLTVYTRDSQLTLPVRQAGDEHGRLDFDPPPPTPAPPVTSLTAGEHRWLVQRDLETDCAMLEVIKDEGRYRLEDVDLEIVDNTHEWFTHHGDEFNSARGEVLSIRELIREDWVIRTRTRTVMTADHEDFHVQAELDAFENGQRVYSRNWNRRIPRRLV